MKKHLYAYERRALLLLGMSGVIAVLSAQLAARREAAKTDTKSENTAKTEKSPCAQPGRDRSTTVDSPDENFDHSPKKPFFASKNEELAHRIGQALARRATCIPCPEYDPVGYPNVHAVWLEGMEMDDVPTRAFAYIGFPEGASADAPVPAMVLQHGGGGFAYPHWVELWNRRGYAAIAVGNTGYRPATVGLTDFYGFDGWTHEAPAEAAGQWCLPPDNDGMYSVDGPIDRMWMYHAVTQTVLANSLLRADPRVDSARIGLTGISWGGVITSIAIGYDPRFAFAIPVYGSGYLHRSLSWMKNNFGAPGVAELWDASLRLRDVHMPVFWLAWSSDFAFSINTNCRSCSDTPKGERTFLLDYGHDHIRGWSPAEIYRFADAQVGRGEPLTAFVTQPEGFATATATIRRPADTTRITARLVYLTEPMTYSADSRLEQTWSIGKATVKGNTVTAVVPPEAQSYYIEVTTRVGGERLVSCSRYVER